MATRTISNAGGGWHNLAAWVEGAVPTKADDVVATATSGNLTISTSGQVCRSIDLTGYTATFGFSANFALTIGNATSPPGGVALKFPISGWTYGAGAGGEIAFAGTVADTVTADFGGVSLVSTAVTVVNGTARTVKLTGHGFSTTGAVTLTQGLLDTNGQTLTIGSFVGTGALIRTLTLGASQITMPNTVTNTWNLSGTNFTLNAGTSLLIFSGAYSSGSTILSVSTFTLYDISITGSGEARIACTGTLTCHNLSRAGTAVKTDALAFTTTGAIAVTNTLTLSGQSLTNRLHVWNSATVVGTSRSVSAAAVSLANVDFEDVAAIGAAAPFTGTSLGDCGGNSGITLDAAVTQHWTNVNGGSWSLSTNWTSRVPLPQDDVVMDCAFGTSKTVTMDMPRAGRSIDWSSATFTTALTWTFSVAFAIYGSLKLKSTVTLSGVFVITLSGRGAFNVTMATKAWVSSMAVAAPGGTYALLDNMLASSVGSITVSAGTLDMNGQDLQCQSFILSGALTREIKMGSGTMFVTRNSAGSGSVMTVSGSNYTITPQTSTIVCNNTASADISFDGNGGVFNNLTVLTGTTKFSMTGANTFNVMTLGAPRQYVFPSGVTTTVTTFVAVGTAGNLITITASTPGAAATLSQAVGTVWADYLSLTDSAATGGASWLSGVHSTLVSGNSGWNLADQAVDTWALVQAAAEAKTDGQTDVWAVVLSSAESLADHASDAWNVALGSSEAIADQASNIVVLVQAALDAKADQAADTWVIVQVGSDAKADQATLVATLLQTAAEALAVSGIDVWAVVLSSAESLADHASDAWNVALGSSEAIADQASGILVLTESSAEALADQAGDVWVIVVSGSYGSFVSILLGVGHEDTRWKMVSGTRWGVPRIGSRWEIR